MTQLFADLNPPPRILMGPGPVGVDPRVLRAMAMPMLGQFDPAFTAYMNETMELLRQLYPRRKNKWSFLVDGTARAGVEAILVSIVSPGDKVLVPVFGRFGHLLAEICKRCGGDVVTIDREWGTVFTPEEIEAAIKQHHPRVLAVVHGDTSTTLAQPLDQIGDICRKHDVLLYTDATASLGGMNVAIDDWKVDAASSGLAEMFVRPARLIADHAQRPRRRGREAPPPCRGGHQAGGLHRRRRADHLVELFRSRHADGLLEREPPQPSHRSNLDAVCGARSGAHRSCRRSRCVLRASQSGERCHHRWPDRNGSQTVRRSAPQDAERHRRLSFRMASMAMPCAA